jgi:hypothetical protein
MKAARVGLTEPPKTVALVAPPETPIKPSLVKAPTTPSTPASSRTLTPSRPYSDKAEVLAFSLKPPIWAPWHGTNNRDLANAIQASLTVKQFAADHNHTTVIRPLHNFDETKGRAEKSMAQLFELYQNHGMTARIWARGTGYQIFGEAKDVRYQEVVIRGVSHVKVDQGEDEAGSSELTGCQPNALKKHVTVVIPLSRLTKADRQYLYKFLREDKRKLLDVPPRKPCQKPKFLQVDTTGKFTPREASLMAMAKSNSAAGSSTSAMDTVFEEGMSSLCPNRKYSNRRLLCCRTHVGYGAGWYSATLLSVKSALRTLRLVKYFVLSAHLSPHVSSFIPSPYEM